MMQTNTAALAVGAGPGGKVTIACAVACGAMAANLYYAQPLVDLIAPELGLRANIAGLIVTLTQLGYGAGLLLIVPLADRIENRRLILGSLFAAAAALALVASAPSAWLFLAACVMLGFCSAGAQIVVPFAAALSSEACRGTTIGNVMSGLLAGIMLARPVSSMIAATLGWRAVFWLASGLMLVTAAAAAGVLPQRRPETRDGYGAILRSMMRLLATKRPLQRRAVYQGIVFAVFNMFWTAVPLLLTSRFGFGQRSIALFALAGSAGALAAPIAGRLGDRGHVRVGTGLALGTIAAGCIISGWTAALGSLLLLGACAIVIDGATQINQVLGQRVVYGLQPDARGRINAIYMTIVFVLGAGGSSIATLTYHGGGWWATMLTAATLILLTLGLFATERRAAEAHA